MDIVYGSIKPETLDSEVSISRKTSIIFTGAVEARRNSGAPGYIKGLKLKTGTLSTDKMSGIEKAKANAYILEPVDGFKLLGANN
jgi:hypothetical protein